jgi:hypothetical protein
MSLSPSTKLCTACQDIFHGTHKAGKPRGKGTHYTNHDDALMLEVEARTGCHFCLLLWNMLTEHEQARMLTQAAPLFDGGQAIEDKPMEQGYCTLPTEYCLEETLDGGYRIQYIFLGETAKSDKGTIKKCVTLSPTSGKRARLICSRSRLTQLSHKWSASGK